MTLTELQDLGYEFEVSGTAYCVTHRVPEEKFDLDLKKYCGSPTGRYIHDDVVDASSMHFVQPKASTIRELAKQSLANFVSDKLDGLMYKSMTSDEYKNFRVLPPRHIISGNFVVGHDWRKKHKSYPTVQNLDQVWEVCRTAAEVDFVKQRLLT